jgi:hypothetical protein
MAPRLLRFYAGGPNIRKLWSILTIALFPRRCHETEYRASHNSAKKCPIKQTACESPARCRVTHYPASHKSANKRHAKQKAAQFYILCSKDKHQQEDQPSSNVSANYAARCYRRPTAWSIVSYWNFCASKDANRREWYCSATDNKPPGRNEWHVRFRFLERRWDSYLSRKTTCGTMKGEFRMGIQRPRAESSGVVCQ